MLTVLQNGVPLDSSKYTFKNKVFESSEEYLTIYCDENGVTFNTESNCTFNTESNCTFKTWSNCTFKTLSNCTFKTWSNCTFNTESNCTFNTRSDCTLLYNSDEIYREFLDEGYFVINDSKGYIPQEVELFETIEKIALLDK